MPSAASFNSALHGSLNFFKIKGIFGSTVISFLFDTGATYSTIGINSFFKGDGYEDEKQAFIEDEIPLGRIGTPADVANVVEMLEKCDYITGQVINIDGGMLM